MNRYTTYLLLIVLLFNSCDNNSDPDPNLDLGVTFIKRLPEIDYVENSSNPGVEGWPDNGQQITWRAGILNQGTGRLEVEYRWLVDGSEQASGSVSIEPGEIMDVDYTTTWKLFREQITFQIDPAALVEEAVESNNELSISTDAMSLGFYVEQTLFDEFREKEQFHNFGINSWYDWAQRQIRVLNERLETYEVEERFRIDHIHLVADGSLPLDKAANDIEDVLGSFDRKQSIPNLQDRSVDVQWGFPADLAGFYDQEISGFLHHEILHGRYLPDNYAFNILHGVNNSRVDIMENGEPLPGSVYFPGVPINFNGVEGLLLYTTTQDDLMANVSNSDLKDLSIKLLNHLKGERPTNGNYNAPSDFVETVFSLLPEQNTLQFLDRFGNPLEGAGIEIYQSSPVQPQELTIYSTYFDDQPDLSFTTDANGEIHMGKNPFGSGELVPFGSDINGLSIFIRIEKDGMVGYEILEASELMIEYLEGNEQQGNYFRLVNLF